MNRLLMSSSSDTPRWSTSAQLKLLSSLLSSLSSLNKKLSNSFLSSCNKKFSSSSAQRQLLSASLGRNTTILLLLFIRRRIRSIIIFPIWIIIAKSSIIPFLEIPQVKVWILDSLSIDKVPVLHKMSDHIDNGVPSGLQANIVPGHPRLEMTIQWWLVVDFCLTSHISSQSFICVIATIPQIAHIHYWVLRYVPSAIAEIQSSHKSNLLINNTTFFMVTP